MEQKVLINNPSRLSNLVSSYLVHTGYNEELKENAHLLWRGGLQTDMKDRSK